MIEILNLILLTAEELVSSRPPAACAPFAANNPCCLSVQSDFRDLLRNCAADGSSGTSESQAVFTVGSTGVSACVCSAVCTLTRRVRCRGSQTLYNCWCHNPVATFSLCLLAQAYDLGAAVVSTLYVVRWR